MGSITIKPSQLANALRREAERHRGALPQAAFAAANRLKAKMMEATDAEGITDRGSYKNSFVVLRSGNSVRVANTAPHAGIIESGARPHAVSKEGIEALAAWAVRKLGVSAEESERVAYAIANGIAVRGQRGRFIFRDHMHLASRYFAEELGRIISKGTA